MSDTHNALKKRKTQPDPLLLLETIFRDHHWQWYCFLQDNITKLSKKNPLAITANKALQNGDFTPFNHLVFNSVYDFFTTKTIQLAHPFLHDYAFRLCIRQVQIMEFVTKEKKPLALALHFFFLPYGFDKTCQTPEEGANHFAGNDLTDDDDSYFDPETKDLSVIADSSLSLSELHGPLKSFLNSLRFMLPAFVPLRCIGNDTGFDGIPLFPLCKNKPSNFVNQTAHPSNCVPDLVKHCRDWFTQHKDRKRMYNFGPLLDEFVSVISAHNPSPLNQDNPFHLYIFAYVYFNLFLQYKDPSYIDPKTSPLQISLTLLYMLTDVVRLHYPNKSTHPLWWLGFVVTTIALHRTILKHFFTEEMCGADSYTEDTDLLYGFSLQLADSDNDTTTIETYPHEHAVFANSIMQSVFVCYFGYSVLPKSKFFLPENSPFFKPKTSWTLKSLLDDTGPNGALRMCTPISCLFANTYKKICDLMSFIHEFVCS